MKHLPNMTQDHAAGQPSTALPGKLGKYRILAQLGRGGMADVYLAVTSGMAGFNKLHVLKHLRRESFDSDDAVHMFAEEARLSALLNHPNVVQTFEVGEDQGAVFMVMEYLEGQSLQSVIRGMRRTGDSLDAKMAVRVIAEVLQGLHYAHELRDLRGEPLRIVHRDVTPHNIFITYDGGVKLLDFGVAKTVSSSTRVGTVKGKVAYLAPEQVSSPELVDRRTDVFQCGLVLWEGLLRRRLWEGMTEIEILARLVKNNLPDLQPPADADPALVSICRRAIAASPDDRYESAEAFGKAIEAFMVERGIRTTTKDVGNRVAQVFAQRRTEVREIIQRRLVQIQDSGIAAPVLDEVGQGIPSLQQDGSTLRTDVPGINRSGTYQSVHSGVSCPSVLHPSPETASGRTRLVVGALALVAVGVSAAAYLLRPAHSPVSASPIASAAPEVAHVELTIETVPPSARVFLDGTLAGVSPSTIRVLKDGVGHVLRAEADGYEAATTPVLFDHDAKHVIRLAPIPPAPAPSQEAAEVSAPASKGRIVVARGRVPSAPVAAARPQSEPSQPPSPPQAKPAGGQVASPKIDNVDPWQ